MVLSLEKASALKAIALTQDEPPFVAQSVVIGALVVLTICRDESPAPAKRLNQMLRRHKVLTGSRILRCDKRTLFEAPGELLAPYYLQNPCCRGRPPIDLRIAVSTMEIRQIGHC